MAKMGWCFKTFKVRDEHKDKNNKLMSLYIDDVQYQRGLQ